MTDKLRDSIVLSMLYDPVTQPIHEPGLLTSTIVRMAKEVPQFGQDLFLNVQEQTNSSDKEMRIQFVTQVKCPDCKEIFDEPRNLSEAHCTHCGKLRKHWSRRFIKRARK